MTSDKSEFHCIVTGRVQGVAYRDFAQSMALELELTGFVANLPDGSVEVLAQGGYGVLKVFRNHLLQGPDNARVKDLYEEWKEPQRDYDGFKVLRT